MNTAARRKEMGDFLRDRREAMVRSEFGLPPASRRRTSGLRREEVAIGANVSVTWYTWLEQGRDINPSRQVLDAVALALHLTPAQHTYILALAGYPSLDAHPRAQQSVRSLSKQRLLDAMTDCPAFSVEPDWTISGWNAAYAALYPNIETTAPGDRNLLWLVFTDPYIQNLLSDWENDSRRYLAEFRADAGPRLGDDSHIQLIERLRSASEHFRISWKTHDIEGFISRERHFVHPVVGDLAFEHHQLIPRDQMELRIIVYLPLPDSTTPARLTRLLTGGGSAGADLANS